MNQFLFLPFFYLAALKLDNRNNVMFLCLGISMFNGPAARLPPLYFYFLAIVSMTRTSSRNQYGNLHFTDPGSQMW
jgi:hypothetical protein